VQQLRAIRIGAVIIKYNNLLPKRHLQRLVSSSAGAFLRVFPTDLRRALPTSLADLQQ
jgi:hypothetical protein